MRRIRSGGRDTSLVMLTGTVTAVAVIAALYVMQHVLMPLALAVFLAFVLSPVVRVLQRGGLPRIAAVLIVVLVAAVVLGGLGGLVGRQVSTLLTQLPNYKDNLREKVRTLRRLVSSPQLGRMIDELSNEFTADGPIPASGEEVAPAKKPTTVIVGPDHHDWADWASSVAPSAASHVGIVLLACVMAIFMLAEREDLRNRLLWAVGHGRLTSTTKAVDEAARRTSRFLFAQAMVNVGYGMIVAVCLALIGVEYPILWGFLAAALRYLPYIGPWIAAAFPIALSLAVFQSWWQPLAVIAVFAVLELLCGNVIDPWLFGHSMGVSGTAFFIAAAFWTWLWGPIGLLLAGPLTIVLVVMGKHVPQMEFLAVLLGDQPALPPDAMFYQRLLARDQDEAMDVVLERLKKIELQQIYDDLLLPALIRARRERETNALTDGDLQFILQSIEEILDDVSVQRQCHPLVARQAKSPDVPRVRIVAYAVRDNLDVAALKMLGHLLDPEQWELEIVGTATLAAELIERLAAEQSPVAFLGALTPGGLARSRYVCKRLRARLPHLKIIVGRWGLPHPEGQQKRLTEAGADAVATSLLEAQTKLNSLHPVLTERRVKASA